MLYTIYVYTLNNAAFETPQICCKLFPPQDIKNNKALKPGLMAIISISKDPNNFTHIPLLGWRARRQLSRFLEIAPSC